MDGDKVPKHLVVAVPWCKPSRAMRHNNYRPSFVANFTGWKLPRLTQLREGEERGEKMKLNGTSQEERSRCYNFLKPRSSRHSGQQTIADNYGGKSRHVLVNQICRSAKLSSRVVLFRNQQYFRRLGNSPCDSKLFIVEYQRDTLLICYSIYRRSRPFR